MEEIKHSVSFQAGQSIEKILANILSSNIFISFAKYELAAKIIQGESQAEYKYSLATSAKDMLDHFALRYQSYKDSGYLNPAHTFYNNLEFDEHDFNAALFIVRNAQTGKLHGTGRLVFDTGQLPLEEYCSLQEYRQSVGKDSKLAEFSRLISYPVHQKELNRKLVKFILEFAAQHATHIVGFGRFDIKHYYERWGFNDLTTPVETFDLSQSGGALVPPMLFYPHAMKVDEIRWEYFT